MTAEPDVVAAVAGFGRTLRSYGTAVPISSVSLALQAMDHLSATARADVYWAGRLAFCDTPDDIDRYDAAFAAYFGGGPRAEPTRQHPVDLPVAVGRDSTAPGRTRESVGPDRTVGASTDDVLRRRDLSDLTASERRRALELIAALRPTGAQRRSRRRRPASRGPVDRAASAREIVRAGGEPTRLRRHRRGLKRRRLLVMVDVSGSMAPYADAALVFAHAAVRARPHTEVFTLGTRLTRVTRQLAAVDVASALGAAGAAIPDWRGGTRLGVLLGEFLRRWGRAGLARGAITVVVSDGWERGDAAPLAREAAHLRRLAARVIWVNPHLARPGYAPLTAGMSAVLPHVDDFVVGHSAQAYADLADLLAGGSRHA
jgi:uncharacterized protein with von Willebrand factor type A (vWA) domain